MQSKNPRGQNELWLPLVRMHHSAKSEHFDVGNVIYHKGQGSIRGVFGPKSKISFTLSNYRFVIWDKNYRRYFVI